LKHLVALVEGQPLAAGNELNSNEQRLLISSVELPIGPKGPELVGAEVGANVVGTGVVGARVVGTGVVALLLPLTGVEVGVSGAEVAGELVVVPPPLAGA
jgi:hypothetical protein